MAAAPYETRINAHQEKKLQLLKTTYKLIVVSSHEK